jgi:predicted dehydrogenase/threonine dehydrogenase-like Zn-dependent dehydrogenase
MKQILQSFKTGATTLEEVPAPIISGSSILIQTSLSLVSLGTERMLVEFGKSSLISKARQQPDKVKQVLEKIASDGLLPTLEAVFSKLEQPLPLGYCNVGVVLDVGHKVTGFQVGDRVVSNGSHAEFVCVPQNLVAKIPENVADEEAVFTVIGSIGLQGIRLCQPALGETVVVVGLGLIGLLTSQMLVANGCRVIGIDVDEEKCQIAQKFGLMTINPTADNNPVKIVQDITKNTGADAVIITASTKSNVVISQAAKMSRKRGRVILIGVVGLDINRADFYEKELTFQVSCSYGPGRYDENYEHHGVDYPLPFVRWTEKRNFEAVLYAIESKSIRVSELISETVELAQYLQIYGNIEKTRSIASILKYPGFSAEYEDLPSTNLSTIVLENRTYKGKRGVIGVIGAGNYSKMTLLPALVKTGAGLKYIASSGGMSGTDLAKKYNFAQSTTNYRQILDDDEVDTIIISTRHDSHAMLVIDSLKAHKHVFVEKPLALNEEELIDIIEVYKQTTSEPEGGSLTVGFNRRFSPHTRVIKKAIGSNPGEINIVATMNAGFIPGNVWVHDLKIGGGRIIGEACHYLDLCVYLTGSKIQAVCMNAMGENPQENSDNASIMVRFENGSNAVVNYFANGAKSYSKERIEVFSRERVFVIDNFRKTSAFGVKGFKGLKSRIDKGHKDQFAKYIDNIERGGEPLIPIEDIINVTRASFSALDSLRQNKWVEV